MKIDSLKQLDRLLALCQKRGVTSITVDGISLNLQSFTKKAKTVRQIDTTVFPEETVIVPQYNGGINEDTPIEAINEETLTDEQLMFYSARPEPGADQ